MSALAAELKADPTAPFLALRATVSPRPAADTGLPEARPPGAMRAARRLLVSWLHRSLRQRARTVAPVPLDGIERYLRHALDGAADSGALELFRTDLLRSLRSIDARIARLGEAGVSQAEVRRIHDEVVASGLAALQHLAEIEVELTAQQAWLDPLTGLPGRRALQQRLQTEHARVRRHGEVCGIALIDLDRFKPVNDNYGHQVGDRYLAAFADALRSHLRPYDAAFRYGGDEFVLCLPQATQDQAVAVMARLREAMRAAPLLQVQGTPLYAEFSCGVAALDAAKTVAQSVGEADARLYLAKAQLPATARDALFARGTQA